MEKNTARKLLSIALVLVIVGSCLGLLGNTAFFSLTTKRITIDTDSNASVAGTLYIPEGVSIEQPAPAVYVLHGGSSSREVMSSYSIELARRGFVVLNCESWGNGDTEIDYSDLGVKASWYAMKYLKTLNYVDQERIGMLAHSAGCGEISSVALGNDNEFGVKALMATGAGYGKFTADTKINLGIMVGYRDENHGTSRVMPVDKGHMEVWGTDQEIVLGQWYGDVRENTGRIMFTPSFMFHNLAKYDPRAVNIITDFFTTALNQADTAKGQVWWLKTVGSCLSFIALFVGIFGFIEYCFQHKFFAFSYKPMEAKRQIVKTPKYYIMMILVFMIGIFMCQKMFVTGDAVMRSISSNFKLTMINGAIFNFLTLGVIAFVINLVMKRLNKSYDWKDEALVYKAPVKDIAKWFLMTVIIFVLSLMLTLFLETYFGYHLSFILPEFFVLKPQRLQALAVYFVPFLVVQLLNQYCQVTSYRTIGASKKSFYFTVLALNTVGMMGYVLVMMLIKSYDLVFPNMWFFRLIGWTSPFARYNSICYYLAIVNIGCSYITVYCFDKTKKIYLGSFINALLLCWQACGNVLAK